MDSFLKMYFISQVELQRQSWKDLPLNGSLLTCMQKSRLAHVEARRLELNQILLCG